MSFPEMSEY